MEYKCPVCGMVLTEVAGESVHPGDRDYGVTLYCSAGYPLMCSAQEVAGHGKNAKDAFEVITNKFNFKKKG